MAQGTARHLHRAHRGSRQPRPMASRRPMIRGSGRRIGGHGRRPAIHRAACTPPCSAWARMSPRSSTRRPRQTCAARCTAPDAERPASSGRSTSFGQPAARMGNGGGVEPLAEGSGGVGTAAPVAARPGASRHREVRRRGSGGPFWPRVGVRSGPAVSDRLRDGVAAPTDATPVAVGYTFGSAVEGDIGHARGTAHH